MDTGSDYVEIDMTDEERAKRIAPEGKIWVCHACGKTATDQYGMEGEHSYGWDESCMLNSGLYDVDKLVMQGSRVTSIKPDGLILS